MSMNEQYSKLAAQLGDVEFKLLKLKAAKSELVKQIDQLDLAARAVKEFQTPKMPAEVPKEAINETKSPPNNAARGRGTP